ncbi:MAG: AAA family ATPase [Kiritimatiellae bacterium]|nr:AAA family ATPase [Kiritimatiellia bacterium]
MSDLDALKQALAASPENVPLNLLLAKSYVDDFQLDDARDQYETAIALDPRNADAQLGLINVINMLGRTSEAIVRLESLCNDLPDHAEAWLLRAHLSLQDGDAKEARTYYLKSIDLNGNLADAALLARIEQAGGKAPVSSSPQPVASGDGYGEAMLESEFNDALGDIGNHDDGLPFDEVALEFSEKPDVTFKDVGGMDAVKEDIRMKILHPLKNKELFEAYGKKVGGGVLLYGPPGCGKTLISRATAGEMDTKYISVGLHQILDMWIGRSEQRLHDIFEFARKHAPTVLFFDEVDALAADRKDMRTSAGRTLINQFLAEMDGASGNNDGVLVLGATNAPWHLDSAFLRPGRFDRIVFVPPPDQAARSAIVDIMKQGRPAEGVDADALAARTKDFSGADLKSVFDQAVESALAEAMKSGSIVPVDQKKLTKAAKTTKPSTRKWFESAKNYATYANQSGFYDDVLAYLGIKP